MFAATSAREITAPLRVLLAEDHAVVRRALRLLLDAQDDLDVVGESDDIPGLVEDAERLRPAVIVCDLTMPSGSALTVLPQLVADGAAVVVLTMEAEPEYARRALRAGAHGYVLKESSPDHLVAAIHAAAAGDAYLDPAMDVRMAPAQAPDRHLARAIALDSGLLGT